MNDQMKSATNDVAAAARELAEKLELLAKATLEVAEDKARELATQAEPFVDKAAAKGAKPRRGCGWGRAR
jgi:hypothetical protein